MKEILSPLIFCLFLSSKSLYAEETTAKDTKIEIPEIVSLQSWEHAKSVNVFIVVSGGAKFGNAFINSGKYWFAGGGFLGDLPQFAYKELGIKVGSVVFITDSIDNFRYSGNPEALSRLFAKRGSFRFAVCQLANCESALPKKYRQYYDENDKKIDYPD